MSDAVSGQERKALVRLLRLLAGGEAVVTGTEDAPHAGIRAADGETHVLPAAAVARAVTLGLVARDGDRLRPVAAARAFLRRAAAERDEAFLFQHADIVSETVEIDGGRQAVRLDRSESPLGPLSRLKDRNGAPFLPSEAVSAGERLAADFMRAQLQPRVTASWEPRLASSSKGGRGGMAELTDAAVAARHALHKAIDAMGPELSGVALDVCCFMKGLEIVERERQWPARSAKLMLRTALLALSRHYAPPPRPSHTQHWGTEDYRPELR